MSTLKAIAFLIAVACLLSVFIGKARTEPVPDYYEIEANVSAYCPCEKCCGDWADGITASGKPAEGKLIAAPRNYPFGTIMDVPGYGRASVEDRGGAIEGNKLDLLFPTHQEALEWGRQYVTVKVWRSK